jgi:phasin family protein
MAIYVAVHTNLRLCRHNLSNPRNFLGSFLMMSPPNNMNDLTSSLTKACEEANALMASYVSAATRSNAAAWQGFEDMTRDMSSLMQETLARAVSACTTLASAKSPQEAADTHADFLKESFDRVVAGSSKISEISMRTAKSAIDPLAQHANDAMGTIMKKAKTA